MRKIILFTACLLLLNTGNAQSSSADKIKMMEYLQNQQYDEAIAYLLPELKLDSANVQLLSLLGYANYMNDNTAAAKKYYEQAFALDSNNIAANQYLAVINNNNNPVAAQGYTQRLIALQPGKAQHHRNMAELLKKTNQRDSALSFYNRAYEIAPGDTKNATGLADMLVDKKNFTRADSITATVLAKDSLNIPCLKLVIRSAYEAKDFQRTIIPGERLMRLDEVSLSALTQLALSYYNLKLYRNCINVCDYMLQHELETESVYYYAARSYAKLKEYSKSNELLQTALAKAISKTAEMYYYTLGENNEATAQFAQAVRQYDTAFYLFKDPLMKYYAGRICETHLKNEKLARKYYTQYLQLANPESAEEKKAYQYVKATWGKKPVK